MSYIIQIQIRISPQCSNFTIVALAEALFASRYGLWWAMALILTFIIDQNKSP